MKARLEERFLRAQLGADAYDAYAPPCADAGAVLALVPGPRATLPRVRTFRWVIVGLLFLATTINYIDRQILALVKSTLDHELGWTNQHTAT